MRLCAIAFKPCWQDDQGRWLSDGGHPLQMAGFASLFDEMTLVIHRRRSPGTGGMLLPPAVDVVPLRSPRGTDLRRKVSVLVHLPYYLVALARIIRRADVVHTAVPSDIGLLGIFLALIMRKKLIVRYSGSWVRTGQTTVANRLTRFLMRLFAGGRNVMLATGEGDEPPARGVSWIFSTALSERELREQKPDCGRTIHRPARLAYIGRLSPEKGVPHLIDAVARLAAEGFVPLPEVTIIGDGPQRKVLEEQVRRSSLEESVQFAGQLDRQALNARLSGMDLCVQPSLTEGFSKAWLDAFVHALPVVASNVGAASSVIGNAGERGWLVPPGDPAALASRLRSVMTETADWPGLRRRCREYAEHRTLEAWRQEIGGRCAEQWGMKLVNGRLTS